MGIFIVGAPRSGTTLLQTMLAAHSKLYSLPETSFFNRIIPQLGVKYFDPLTPVKRCDLELIYRDIKLMTGFNVDYVLEIQEGVAIRDVFEKLCAGFNKQRKPNWVEKTTNHVLCMEAIQRYYPNAKFIHMIRDPVGSVGSMINIKPIGISDMRISYFPSIFYHSTLWNKCIESAHMFPRQENVKHVRYEDLVARTRVVLEDICRYLEIEYEESMIANYSKQIGAISRIDYCPWQADNKDAFIHEEAVFKWRKILPKEEVWLIQHYTKDWALRLGYYEKMTCSKFGVLGVVLKDYVKRGIVRSRLETMVRRIWVHAAMDVNHD